MSYANPDLDMARTWHETFVTQEEAFFPGDEFREINWRSQKMVCSQIKNH